MHVEPYRIFECNGVRIGVLGLIQLGTNGLPDSHPKNLANIHFRSPLKVAQEYAWLRDRCDVFIILSHNGYEEDLALAKEYPIADVILGGHSHSKIEGTMSNGVLVTQAEKQLKYVTELTLKLADGKVIEKKAHLINVKDNPKKDEKVQAMVNEFNDNKELKRVVAQAKESFLNKEELGCMMADAIRIESGADIALQNSGGVRLDSFPAGPISLGDVYRLDPFGNEMIMSGYLKNIRVKEGDYVSVGQPLVTIAQSNRLVLRAEVSEKYYNQLPSVWSANFRTPYDDVVYKLSDLNGRMLSFGKSSDSDTFYLPVTFEFDNRGAVIPGSFVEVYLLTAPTQNVLSVPEEALIEEQGLYSVYVRMDEDCFMKHPVTLGADNGKDVQILSGIKAGDEVVTEGAHQVKLASASNVIPPHSHHH